jgi:hypothetical protein
MAEKAVRKEGKTHAMRKDASLLCGPDAHKATNQLGPEGLRSTAYEAQDSHDGNESNASRSELCAPADGGLHEIVNVNTRGVISLRPVTASSTGNANPQPQGMSSSVGCLDETETACLHQTLAHPTTAYATLADSMHSMHSTASKPSLHGDGADVAASNRQIQKADRPGDAYYRELQRAAQRSRPGQEWLKGKSSGARQGQEAKSSDAGHVLWLSTLARHPAPPTPDTCTSQEVPVLPVGFVDNSHNSDLAGSCSDFSEHFGKWAGDEALRLVARHQEMLLAQPLLLVRSVPPLCRLDSALPLLSW